MLHIIVYFMYMQQKKFGLVVIPFKLFRPGVRSVTRPLNSALLVDSPPHSGAPFPRPTSCSRRRPTVALTPPSVALCWPAHLTNTTEQNMTVSRLHFSGC